MNKEKDFEIILNNFEQKSNMNKAAVKSELLKPFTRGLIMILSVIVVSGAIAVYFYLSNSPKKEEGFYFNKEIKCTSFLLILFLFLNKIFY